MKNVVIDRDGYRYRWTVRGLDEGACARDIKENGRTGLSDYRAVMFGEQYGCVAEVKRVRLMSHNQYLAYMQHNANRLYADDSYSVEDYRRDADRVEVLPFRLERFKLDAFIEEYVNKRFTSISYTPEGDACLQCSITSSVGADFIAQALGCEAVCNQGYSGFFKNDTQRLILEFCEGEASLLICGSQKTYAAHLAEYKRAFDIQGYDVCLEVYFDNVHMDNLFLPKENVGMVISSLLQRGYDGYNKEIKSCWEALLAKKQNPKLSFRVVEAPAMVRDLDMVLHAAFERTTANSGGKNKLVEFVL